MPEKIAGSAPGNSIRLKIAQRFASSVFIMWMKSSSTERRPSRPFTTMGKKQISATITSLGMIP